MKSIYLGGERITMPELTDNISQLRTWSCRIIQNSGSYQNYYWKENYHGYTSQKSEAGMFNAESVYNDQLTQVLVELISPSVGDESKPKGETAKDRILLTIKQAQNARDSIGNKMCRWVIQNGDTAGQWAKKPLGNGGTWDPELAQEFKVNTLLDTYRGSSFKIDMLDQEEAERVSKIPVRLCFIEEALPPDLIEGLKIAPTNETYHGLILKYAGKMPPQSITEFNRLKEWIEFNCEPKVKIKVKPHPSYFVDGYIFHGTQQGTCNYTLPTTGTGSCRWATHEIEAVITGFGDDDRPESVDELLQQMDKMVNPWDHAPENMEVVDPDGLSNFNPSASVNERWEIAEGNEARKARFITHLRGILSREQLEQLGIAP